MNKEIFEMQNAKNIRIQIIKILEPYQDNPNFIMISLFSLISEMCEIMKMSSEDFRDMLLEISEQYSQEVKK